MTHLDELTDRVRRVAAANPDFTDPVTLDLGEAGLIHMQGGSVSHEDVPGSCRVALSPEDLRAMMEGRLDPTTAYMTGQIRIEGDLGKALRLSSALRR